MHHVAVLLVVLLSGHYVSAGCEHDPKVRTKQGLLRGGKNKTENGFEYFEFLKVPYAKPPLGELRFKSPQPVEPWKGERDATYIDNTNVCYQIDGAPRGTEDCLYLNVYTPRLPSPGSEPLAVMVYIHGGGFTAGSGTNKLESGQDYLVEKDVVVVAINYRLNIFGFISLGIPEAAGNMGLKDQIMALKWIQENIGAFGGNKDKVTVFGISAGSAAIETHLMSPLGEGLFHRAILQSGSTLSPWAINNNNIKDIAFEVAQKFGYQGTRDDNNAIHHLLMRQPTELLGETAYNVTVENPRKILFYNFYPVIEEDFGNGEAYLTENPSKLLNEGRFRKIDVIRGFTEFEGLIYVGSSPQTIEYLEETKNFTYFCETYLHYSDTAHCDNTLKQLYYEVDKSAEDKQQFAINFAGDFDITSGVWIGSQLMAQHGAKVYSYMFAYDGNMNYVKIFLDIKKKGACHADDIGYLMSVTFPVELHVNLTDILTRQRLVQMWSDFAKTGNPTPVTSSLVAVSWPAFTDGDQRYMRIDSDLSIQQNYKPDRIAFFQKSFENSLQ